MMKLKQFVKLFIPKKILVLYYEYCWIYKIRKLKKKIIKYIKTDSSDMDISEKNDIIKFLKHNPLSVFPYDFIKKHNPNDIIVYTDESQRKYVLHENKRLYFKKCWSEEQIKNYYNGLLTEQDIDSPHCYETADFHVDEGYIVVDAGAAEGIFALSVIEKARKVYLLEIDEEWIDALTLTFVPWKEKVEIICKYVSDNDDGNCITFDTFLGKEEKKIFIKADVEGAEIALLKGSRNILSNTEKLKVVICTYHKQTDAEEINMYIRNLGYTTEFSKGYMIFIYDNTLCAPYLRRGLLRGVKVDNW